VLIYFQTSLRKILAYSSITHISWILLIIINYNNNWITYFFIYSIIIVTIFLNTKNYNISTIEERKIIYSLRQSSSIIITIISLRGLPPFLGFMPKWIAISISKEFLFTPILILIISTLLSIFIYLHFLYPIIFNKLLKSKWHLTNSNKTSLITNTLLLIPLSPIIFF